MKQDFNQERLGKIVALAKHGYAGEKTAAISMVKNICKKYGLNFEEVMSGEEEKREYTIPWKTQEECRVVMHIVMKYAGTPSDEIYENRWRKVFIFKTTQEKYIETLNAVSVLAPLFRREKKRLKDVLFYGFLTKHDLFYNPTPEERAKQKKKKDDEISEEELANRRAGSNLADHMQDANIHKQLTSDKSK